jgi:predicted nucleic acid-binding protein
LFKPFHKRIQFLLILRYVLSEHPTYIEVAEQVLRTVESQATVGIISIVTLVEILTIPEQHGDDEASRAYEMYLRNFPNLTIRAVEFDIARTAAQLRGKFKLRTPDALQIATVLVSQASIIITNDKQWRGKTAAIPVLSLDEFI